MTLPTGVEIAVIGAGPAGSVLSAALAGRGRDVVLLERDCFPRDKVCGEFLSPESAACLERLGSLKSFLAMNPSKMNRARLTVADGSTMELSLPGQAYGLSRRRLDHFLFEEAAEAGAQVFEGVDVRRIEEADSGRKRLVVRHNSTGEGASLEADVVVAAYGRRSRMDRQMERAFFQGRSPYVAFKRHHRVCDELDPELHGFVELHTFDGGYCGVSHVEGDIVNICTMFDRRLLDDMDLGAGLPIDESIWKGLSAFNRALSRRLAGLTPCESRAVTVAQISLGLKERSRQGIFFVGDSAGMIAPLAGDGQAMAMESALAFADLLHDHLPELPYRPWASLWRRRYEPRIRLGRWLQKAMVRPRIAGPALHVLRRCPPAGQAMMEWTRG